MRRPAPFAAPDPEAGQSTGAAQAAADCAGLAVSNDGYLRLTLTAFRAIIGGHAIFACWIDM